MSRDEADAYWRKEEEMRCSRDGGKWNADGGWCDWEGADMKVLRKKINNLKKRATAYSADIDLGRLQEIQAPVDQKW